MKAVRRIEGFAKPSARARAKLDDDDLVAAIETVFTVGPGDSDMDWPRFDLALCSLAGVTYPSSGPGDLTLRRLAVEALSSRLAGSDGGSTAEYLYGSVLPADADATEDQRVGALVTLEGQFPERAQELLRYLSMSDTSTPRVRETAARALVGWADMNASRALVSAAELAKGADARRLRDLLAEHLFQLELLRSLDTAFPADLGPRLAALIGEDIASDEWRTASRALPLARFIPIDEAAPHLIDALEAWLERESSAEEAEQLVGCRRLIEELTMTLRQLSGRQIGSKINSWRTWWKNYDPAAAATDAADDGATTRAASFFGLEIQSGAVAFLIDASGSMEGSPPREPGSSLAPGGSDGNRYDEAVKQLTNALADYQSPIGFRLALFSTGAKIWRKQLTLANEKGQKEARRWLQRFGPDGGTELGSGMEALFPTTARGDLLNLPQVDTVVILCDGETVENADWARNWIEHHNREAELVFHCLQIGGGRAEALRTLAELSGGTFVSLGGGR